GSQLAGFHFCAVWHLAPFGISRRWHFAPLAFRAVWALRSFRSSPRPSTLDPGLMADEIDYKLIGDDLQAVIITLDPGEMVQAEAGAMMYMQDGIVMNTTLDPNAQGGGLLGRLFAGAKRALSGDTFFVTTFANAANTRQDVAFSSHFPGKILPIDLREWNGRLIAQKDCFLCAARGINVTIAFTKRIGAGFFGGEGFILQKIEGDGLTFLHAAGTMHEITLGPGESLRVDTGC